MKSFWQVLDIFTTRFRIKSVSKALKNLFKVQHPDNIVTFKGKIVYWLYWQWHLKEQGAGQLMKITKISGDIALALLVIDRFTNWSITWWGIGLAIFSYMFISWLGGALFIYYDLDLIEASISLVRNPFQRDLHKLIKKDKKTKL